MAEIRVDPLTGLRVAIVPDRRDRPGALAPIDPAPPIDPASDPFAPGNESETMPEVAAERPDGSAPDGPGWLVRAMPNRYPILTPDAPDPEPTANRDLYWSGPARGAHEVIVNAPESVSSLADCDVEQVARAVELWRARMRVHEAAACRHLFVNEGAAAGATQPHTHAQLLALPFVPSLIARERERFGAYATQTLGGNLLADLVQQEVRHRRRIVAIDSEAVLLSTYAAQVPFQMTLAPRVNRLRFEDDGPAGAAMLHGALRRLRAVLGVMPPVNLWVRTAPSGAEHFCWRIDILPRLLSPAGVELGAGIGVNQLAPEDAAQQLAAAAV